MCTARTKLKEVENEMDCLYAELRVAKNKLEEARKETEAAELETQIITNRNMCLLRNIVLSNTWMIYSLILSFILLGLVVYGL